MPRRNTAAIITGTGWLLFTLPVIWMFKFSGAVVELSASWEKETMGS